PVCGGRFPRSVSLGARIRPAGIITREIDFENGKGVHERYNWTTLGAHAYACGDFAREGRMKLGIFYGGSQDVEGHIQGAVDAENDGFDSVWYGQIFGPDVLTVISVAGARTSRIQFGTSVVPTYARHPTVMAQQALTAQAATNGRFNLGIGL